jgi:hypothetical protein
MQDFVDFLGFINEQLATKQVERLEAMLRGSVTIAWRLPSGIRLSHSKQSACRIREFPTAAER